MDPAKRKGTVYRTAFTKALSTLDDLLNHPDKDVVNINVALQLLDEKMSVLNSIAEIMMELMYKSAAADTVYEKDAEEIDDYKKRYYQAKCKVESLRMREIVPTVSASPITVGEMQRKPIKLPKIELVNFSDNVRDWLQFWSLFRKINDDPNMDRKEKFQYLTQAMEINSRAADLVKSYPPTAENYDKVIISLKNRFGREDILIEVYVQELIQLAPHNAVKPINKLPLSHLCDKLESHLRALDILDITTDKCAAMLLALVESSLLEELLRAWQRSRASQHGMRQNTAAQAKNRLTRLIEFIEAEVRSDVRITMVMQGFDHKSTDSVQKKPKNLNEHIKGMPSAVGLFAGSGKETTCLFCEAKEHVTSECDKAKKMTLAQRQEIVKAKRACFFCLKLGHVCRACRRRLKCAKCEKRHLTI